MHHKHAELDLWKVCIKLPNLPVFSMAYFWVSVYNRPTKVSELRPSIVGFLRLSNTVHFLSNARESTLTKQSLML